MPNWKKIIVSGSDAQLNSVNATSFTGSLLGTASNAISASYALTASYISGIGPAADTTIIEAQLWFLI